jgi:adenylate cyclase
MGADETKTLNELRDLNAAIIAPVSAAHDGKIVKVMGDGWLIEFDSAVNAVNCAMKLQDKLVDHPSFRLRIGIHAGDVIHQNDDVFGDAVNVAARLEARATPGGVLISDAAYASLDGTLTPSKRAIIVVCNWPECRQVVEGQWGQPHTPGIFMNKRCGIPHSPNSMTISRPRGPITCYISPC